MHNSFSYEHEINHLEAQDKSKESVKLECELSIVYELELSFFFGGGGSILHYCIKYPVTSVSAVLVSRYWICRQIDVTLSRSMIMD